MGGRIMINWEEIQTKAMEFQVLNGRKPILILGTKELPNTPPSPEGYQLSLYGYDVIAGDFDEGFELK